MLTVEDVILSRGAADAEEAAPERGMEKLRSGLPPDFCRSAAASLLALERGAVLLTTGFYVAGAAETDGPPGTLFLAKALNALGFHCVIVTDRHAAPFFDGTGIPVEEVPLSVCAEELTDLLNKYAPRACIAVERCGLNARGDYANMRGESIASHTAKLDPLFEAARLRCILTVGVGDGGNEIGMGNFREIIERELSLVPCVTEVDFPIIATVSNWGAYGLCACLGMLTGKPLFPRPNEVSAYLRHIVALGSVDGVTKRHTPTVDGFPEGSEEKIIEALHALTNHRRCAIIEVKKRGNVHGQKQNHHQFFKPCRRHSVLLRAVSFRHHQGLLRHVRQGAPAIVGGHCVCLSAVSGGSLL